MPELKLVFVWGNEKCDRTQVYHLHNNSRALVLKNMNKVFDDINPHFKEFFHHNTLFIDDCPTNAWGMCFYFISCLINSTMKQMTTNIFWEHCGLSWLAFLCSQYRRLCWFTPPWAKACEQTKPTLESPKDLCTWLPATQVIGNKFQT